MGHHFINRHWRLKYFYFDRERAADSSITENQMLAYGVTLDLSDAGTHVPPIERPIQTVKRRSPRWLNLDTNREVVSSNFTPLPIPENVIDLINSMPGYKYGRTCRSKSLPAWQNQL